jgi:competence ComEA-like helix-hairpin-helix protein
MKLTNDESRALAFIAGLLLLSAAVRVVAAREPVPIPGEGFDVAGHLDATREAVSDAERARRPLAPGERIDPNTADAVDLDRLPRVGPALAGRIVRDREANGPFRSAEDLRRVRGVGARMLEALRPRLAVPTGGRAGGGGGEGGAGARRPRATAAPDAVPGDRAAGRRGERPEPIDVNRADAAALATLPGIGPVLAARIVAYRDSVGPFPDLDALVAVRGVGPATLERLRPLLRAGAR